MKKMLTVCGLALGLAAASTAFAKLPAPPSTPEAKLKAAETAAKTAWTGKGSLTSYFTPWLMRRSLRRPEPVMWLRPCTGMPLRSRASTSRT